MTVVIELQYFPAYTLIKQLGAFTHVLFEQYESFQKMSFRNRMVVAGGTGPILLTVPVRNGRNQKSMMRAVEIDSRVPWQASHWKTLTSCYRKAPWFELYEDSLTRLYKTEFRLLIDWNLACFQWAVEKLNFPVTVSLTENWVPDYTGREITDWRNKHSSMRKLESVAVQKYNQVFIDRTGFIPNLSVLDCLFCEGPRLQQQDRK